MRGLKEKLIRRETKYMLEHNAPWYARNNIAVLAWECLAKGFMAGKWNEADAERIGKDYMDIKKGKKRPLEPTGEHSHEWREMQLVRAYATLTGAHTIFV